MTGHGQGEDCSVTTTPPIASLSGQHTGCFGVGTPKFKSWLWDLFVIPHQRPPPGGGEGMESCPSH